MAGQMSALVAFASLLLLSHAPCGLGSAGDTDQVYQHYLAACATTGCAGSVCIEGCLTSPENLTASSPAAAAAAAAAKKVAGPLPLVLTQWDCYSECKYQCMVLREKEREEKHAAPVVKYYGKWPFLRFLGIQEPASVVFSALNLAATVWGVKSFVDLVYSQLPRKPTEDKGPIYEYASLFLLYGIAQANAWLWSTVFHARDVFVTERLDYFSAVALLGVSLIVAIIRVASLRVEAARVMVAAPIIAWLTTHCLYLSFFRFDYGWNMVVCSVIGVGTLVLWTAWASMTAHPSSAKVWACSLGAVAAMLLEIFDFPPLLGVLDAHSLWHAATIPLTLLWWSFLADDARFRTRAIADRTRRAKAPAMKKTD